MTRSKKTLLVALSCAGKAPVACYIEPTLKEMQSVVGGLIEHFPLTRDLALICNEEGKINRMPVWFAAIGPLSVEPIAGNFFIARINGDDLTSIIEEVDMPVVERRIVPIVQVARKEL